MRHARGIHYALLGVVSQNPTGVHGYALKRQCDRILGHFWQLNFGEVYRILDHLAEDGLIQAVLADATTSRKVFRITDKGRRSLDTFILEPPTDTPRPLRQELAVKLLFAGPERMPELVRLIDAQRDTYMRQLHLLATQRRKLRGVPVDSFVTNLLIDGAELNVRAELAWLEDVGVKLKQRFGASRVPAA
jgi:DNA-binding PadR family transcriptional regulator